MAENNSNVIAVRVKVKPKKSMYINTIVGCVLSFIIGIGSLATYFLNNSNAFLYLGVIFLTFAAFLGIFIPFAVNNYKTLVKEINYPLEAIKLVDDNSIEVITDKVETVRFDEIKKVVGTNSSTTTNYGFVMKTTEYKHGPMAIHLKDGRKINLYNIDNVNQVVSVLDSLKK